MRAVGELGGTNDACRPHSIPPIGGTDATSSKNVKIIRGGACRISAHRWMMRALSLSCSNDRHQHPGRRIPSYAAVWWWIRWTSCTERMSDDVTVRFHQHDPILDVLRANEKMTDCMVALHGISAVSCLFPVAAQSDAYSTGASIAVRLRFRKAKNRTQCGEYEQLSPDYLRLGASRIPCCRHRGVRKAGRQTRNYTDRITLTVVVPQRTGEYLQTRVIGNFQRHGRSATGGHDLTIPGQSMSSRWYTRVCKER